MWRVWLKALKKLCQPTSWNLQNPLGNWFPNHAKYRYWDAYRGNNNLIHVSHNQWRIIASTPTRDYYQQNDTNVTNDLESLGNPIIPEIKTPNTIIVDRYQTQHINLHINSQEWYHELTSTIQEEEP
jgi:hypothetical protein